MKRDSFRIRVKRCFCNYLFLCMFSLLPKNKVNLRILRSITLLPQLFPFNSPSTSLPFSMPFRALAFLGHVLCTIGYTAKGLITNNNPRIICAHSHCCHTLLARQNTEVREQLLGRVVYLFVSKAHKPQIWRQKRRRKR